MKKNLGNTDRAIRVILAITFAIFYFTHLVTGTVGIVLLVLSVTLLLTSFFSFCPLYVPFRLSTLEKEAKV